MTADHPLDELLRLQLIRALRDSGRAADALSAYEDARRTLADRLGTDPGPELRALHSDLLSGGTDARLSEDSGHHDHGDGHDLHDVRDEIDVRDDIDVRDASGPAGRPDAPPPAPDSLRARLPEQPAGSPAPRPSARRGNLRARLTSFVGRELELADLRRDMTTSRLVTLTGPGGSGKTRLSEEFAAATAAAHPDGVWIAELASLEAPEGVPGAVLSALGRRETSVFSAALEARTTKEDVDQTTRLLEYCAHRRLLLILDNCEHVIDAAAELAEALLTRCPDVTILATSREPLSVPGEVVRPLEPLPPVPAHRLFAERAATVRPGFRSEEDPAAIAEICRRLDGLPLAIELAAARLRLLSPRQIADRLDDRFRLLTSGSRTVLPRRQTLRAVVDWSWDLLDERERTLLRGLSVFARRVGDRWLLAQMDAATGEILQLSGDYEAARAAYGEALTLTYELGSFTEAPFILARLAEVSFAAGELRAAEKELLRADESTAEHAVQDTVAYSHFLRARIALGRGEVPKARAACEAARRESALGTPPPLFHVEIASLEGRLAAESGDLRGALRTLGEALRTGARSLCGESLLAGVAENAARTYRLMGLDRAAAELLGAADAWRGELPRTVPDREDVERTRAEVRGALGGAYAEAHAEGARLTPAHVADRLDDAVTS